MAETPPLPRDENHTSNSGSIQLKDKLDYAWKWFEYHASQRLVAFNFLLVLMGALSVGYYKAYTDKEHVCGLIIGLFGAFVSFAFLNLDKRNEELVQRGRDALKSLENLRGFSALPEGEDPCRLLNKDASRSRFISHAFWLRWISRSLFLIFLVASFVSGLKLIGKWT